MAYRKNDAQQLSFDDSALHLTERESKVLEKSWAAIFSERIFDAINEAPFAVLYGPDNSRPNTPVNVIIGALILKELFGLSDEEMVQTLMFDVRFQYALHTTSFKEQPLSDRTLSRFRARVIEYEQETGIDLLHDTLTQLFSEMATLMKVNTRMRRMDSMMVESNIKRLGRFDLIYTCVANLVRKLKKIKETELIDGLERYCDPADYNRTVYHERSDSTDTRLTTLLSDAKRLLDTGANSENCANLKEFSLLARVISEQTIVNGDGSLRLRTKDDGGMDSDMLQSPSDPEATYRKKAGKEHRGYAANFTEATSNEDGIGRSLILDYQYEQNNFSDVRFLQNYLEKMPDVDQLKSQEPATEDSLSRMEEQPEKSESSEDTVEQEDCTGKDGSPKGEQASSGSSEPGMGPRDEKKIILITDGAYANDGNTETAKKKNVDLFATALTGRDVKDVYADFQFSEDGQKIESCPAGNEPKECTYRQSDNKVTATFSRYQCEGCEHQQECCPYVSSKQGTAKVTLSKKSSDRAKQQRFRDSETFREYSNFRNGVESIPSVLRRKYHVDDMPVRGKLRTKLFLGAKVGALNCKKFIDYLTNARKESKKVC